MTSTNNKNAVLSPSESKDAADIVADANRVSDRIVDAAGVKNRLDWETVVVKSNNVNAFVMPNGKIIIFTGLSPVAKTSAGLAAVISHEVAHVIAHHQAERLSQVLLAEMVLTMADIALATSGKTSQ